MKFFLIIITTSLLILSACNSENNEEDKKADNSNFYSWGELLRAERDFNAKEEQIGRDVCLALRDKRTFFSGLDDRRYEFSFIPGNALCGQRETRGARFSAWLRTARTEFRFEPKNRSNRMIEGILTDLDDRLKSVCDALINNRPHKNIVNVEGQNHSITFFENSTGKFVYAAQFRKVEGREKLQLVDIARIVTRGDSPNSDHNGIAAERVIFRACATDRLQSVQRQTWN